MEINLPLWDAKRVKSYFVQRPNLKPLFARLESAKEN